MVKFVLILMIGVAFGYSFGWTDAQKHEQHLAERLLDRLGGETRARMGNDVDAHFQGNDGK